MLKKETQKFLLLTSLIFLALMFCPFIISGIPKNDHKTLGITLHFSYYLIVYISLLILEKKLNTRFKIFTGSILIPFSVISIICLILMIIISPERFFTINTFNEYILAIGYYYYQYGLLASIAIIIALLLRSKVK